MAKYMLILGGADLDKRSGNAELSQAMLQQYMTWMRGLKESGRYVASYKLYDQTGKRLTLRGGEVVDGPFVETKDAIGGVFVVEAASLDEATAIGRECPVLRLQNGYVEVRVVEQVLPAAR
jgi:hypothetical protein